MGQFTCEYCTKKFDSQQGLNQHQNDKHPKQTKLEVELPRKKVSKKIILYAAITVFAIGLVYWLYSSMSVTKPVYIPLTPKTEHFKGLSNATVTVVEFSDFQCPACAAAYPEVKQLMENYGSKIKFVYKHFPLTQIHPNAFKASEASECAADQGRFWEYHDQLFENRKLEISDLRRYADDIGLNTTLFNACLDSDTMKSRVNVDVEEALKLSVGATPTFFINGKKYEGVMRFYQFQQIIDGELD